MAPRGPEPTTMNLYGKMLRHWTGLHTTRSSYYNIGMELPTSPLSSLPAMSSPPTFDNPDTYLGARQSARSNDEKLELAIKYMREDLYFSIGDFIRALSTSKCAASGKRRAAFSKRRILGSRGPENIYGR